MGVFYLDCEVQLFVIGGVFEVLLVECVYQFFSSFLVIVRMLFRVKLKCLNSVGVGVDLLKLVMLMMCLLRLMYLYQQLVWVVSMVMCVLIFIGSMDCLQDLFCCLQMLVYGIDIMWILWFCLLSLLQVCMVRLIFELVVIRISFGLFLQFFSMQLLWVMLVIWVMLCVWCGRFWWEKISVDGLLVCLMVCFQVIVDLIVLVGCQVFRFGVRCRLVSCLIGWWVGLFLLRLMELWVNMQSMCCFINVDMCMVLCVYFMKIRKVVLQGMKLLCRVMLFMIVFMLNLCMLQNMQLLVVLLVLMFLQFFYRVRLELVRLVELLSSFGSNGLKVFSVFWLVLWLVMVLFLLVILVMQVVVFLVKLVGSLFFRWCSNLVVSFGWVVWQVVKCLFYLVFWVVLVFLVFYLVQICVGILNGVCFQFSVVWVVVILLVFSGVLWYFFLFCLFGELKLIMVLQQIRVGWLFLCVVLMVVLILLVLCLLMLWIICQLQVLKCFGVLLVNQLWILLLMEMLLLLQKVISLFRCRVLVSEVILWEMFFIMQLLLRKVQVQWLIIVWLLWLNWVVRIFFVSVMFIVLVMFWLSGLVVVLMLVVQLYFGWFGVCELSWWKFFRFSMLRLYLVRCSREQISIELWLLDSMKWLWLVYCGLFGLCCMQLCQRILVILVMFIGVFGWLLLVFCMVFMFSVWMVLVCL